MSGICLTCSVDNCLSCSSDNVCSSCRKGYNLDSSASSITNQCFRCIDPCTSCFSDGSCKTCKSPYSQVVLTQGQDCILCSDPRCTTCFDSNNGSCTVCSLGYELINGSCTKVCSDGCQSCTNSTVCTVCFSQFYYLTNQQCKTCPNSPACINCLANSPNTCTKCNQGYYLSSSNTCLPCQSYCKVCTSSTYCKELFNFKGFTLIEINSTHNAPAACNQGCISCSSSNPQVCS